MSTRWIGRSERIVGLVVVALGLLCTLASCMPAGVYAADTVLGRPDRGDAGLAGAAGRGAPPGLARASARAPRPAGPGLRHRRRWRGGRARPLGRHQHDEQRGRRHPPGPAGARGHGSRPLPRLGSDHRPPGRQPLRRGPGGHARDHRLALRPLRAGRGGWRWNGTRSRDGRGPLRGGQPAPRHPGQHPRGPGRDRPAARPGAPLALS